MPESFSWPPDFTIRHSHRVRQVRLQMCPRHGLEIVVPMAFKVENAGDILEKHRAWIERTWLRMKPQVTRSEEIIPEKISLLAINEVWKVNLEFFDINRITLNASKKTNELILRGNTQSTPTIKIILKKWLRQKATETLLPWLEKLSVISQLEYSHAKVRDMNTRWGSCSDKKHISLCCRLLFLTPELVEYVLLHELCHTIHLDHSKNFWKLLQRLNPDCHQLRKQIKAMQIPEWVL